MITSKSFEERLQTLAELDVAERDIIPGREPSFNVYLNTRKIEVPPSFKQLAVQGEHNAETIWFALDRYFDGVDLRDKTWGVQFVNADKEELLVAIDYKQLDKDNDKTLLIGWDVPFDITKSPGTVLLSLRCFELNDDNTPAYDLRTEYVSLTIGKSLNINEFSDNLLNPPADSLTRLVHKIEELYMDKQLTDLKYEEIESKPTINSVELSAGENDASKFNIRYDQLDQTTLPTITVDGQSYTIGVNEINVSKITVDEALKDSENPVQNKVVNNEFITTKTTFTNAINATKTELDGKISTTNSELEKTNAEIDKIWAELGNMTYIPLSIKSFESDITFLKKNEVFNGIVNFVWTVDGNVKSQKIEIKQNNEIIDTIDLSTDARTCEYQTTNWSDDIECILTVTSAQDEKTATVNIIFTYEVFYGISTVETFADNSFTGLEGKILSTSKSIGSFTVDASGENYMYYCSPTEYGVPIFRYGVLSGGFILVNENIEYNNTNYNIYKSEHKGLGETTIIVE